MPLQTTVLNASAAQLQHVMMHDALAWYAKNMLRQGVYSTSLCEV